MKDDLGAKLSAYLQKYDRPQSYVAQKLNKSPSTVTKWINGTNQMPAEAIRDFCELLRLSDETYFELLELGGYSFPPPPSQKVLHQWPPTLPWNDFYYPLPERDKELEAITEELKDKRGRWGVFISGLGGLGKTASAIDIARRCLDAHAFERVLGDSAKLEFLVDGRITRATDDARLSFEGFLDEVGTQLDYPEIRTKPLTQKRRLLQELLNQKPYLVIIDNLETAEDADQIVREFPPLLGRSRAIITSRKTVSKDRIPAFAKLEELEENDALVFLRQDAQVRHCKDISEASNQELKEIFQNIGRQPLALKLIVGQVANFGLHFTLKNIKAKGNMGGVDNLYRFIYWDSWQTLSSTAQRMLIQIGRKPAPVSLQVLHRASRGATDELMMAIEQLSNLSLINVMDSEDAKRYTVHELTRRFINADLPKLWRPTNIPLDE